MWTWENCPFLNIKGVLHRSYEGFVQFPYVQTDNVVTFLKSKSNLIQKETERRRSFIAWHLDPVITFQRWGEAEWSNVNWTLLQKKV